MKWIELYTHTRHVVDSGNVGEIPEAKKSSIGGWQTGEAHIVRITIAYL
jgi:hypothetical protein